jgi:EmrB/QacA subfamily drug resistance transporter
MSRTPATRPVPAAGRPAAPLRAAPASGGQADSRWPGGHPRRRQILLVLCLSLLVVVIDNTILNTALPTLARVLHAGTSSLQWITDAYTLCFAALLIPAGALGDRYGRRLSLLGGLAVFALGSTAAAVATGTGMLIAARVVMGLGAAFVMPATLSILNAVFPPRERPQAIAAWSAVAGVGIVIGPTLGGLLLTHFWWGSVFLINVPLVAIALAGVLLMVPETAEPGIHRLDIPGTLLVAGALFAIVDAIIEAPARGWTGAATLAEAAAGLAMLGIFTWWELRIEHPLIDLRIFTSRAFSTAAASVTVIFFALFGSLFVLTQYLQLVHGYSPLSAGLRALPFAFAMAAVSPVSPVLAKRLGTRLIIPAGMALMGGGLLDLSTAGVHTAYPAVAVAVAIMGAGMGLVMAPASTTIMTTVPAHQAGAGSAINDTIREVGGALGVAIVGSLSAAVYRSRLGSVLAVSHAPGHIVHVATSSVAAADIAGQRVGGPQGSELISAAHAAFVHAMAMGIRLAAAVALVSAVAALFALPRRSRPQRQQAGAAEAGRPAAAAPVPAVAVPVPAVTVPVRPRAAVPGT